MIPIYKDELKKQSYYKEQIMQQIASTGVYPALTLIKQQIDDIDLKLSIFSYTFHAAGSTFDVALYNQELEQIYADLQILYECINELSVAGYTELYNYIQRELRELQDVSNMYVRRTDTELTNMFGNTVFFQGSGFDQQYINGNIEIMIGDITVHDSSRIACFIDGTDLPDTIYFKLGEYTLSSYSINSDMLKIPGELNYTTYNVTQNKDQQNTTSFPVQLENFTPDVQHTYHVFAGKNKIQFIRRPNAEGDSTLPVYMDVSQNQSLYFEQDGEITFYIYNGSTITLDTSQELVSLNLSKNQLANISRIQKVKLEVAAGTAMEIHTDGIIYTEIVNSYIKDSIFYISSGLPDIHDYMIEEASEPDTRILSDCKVIIQQADKPYYEITSIAIKESQATTV